MKKFGVIVLLSIMLLSLASVFVSSQGLVGPPLPVATSTFGDSIQGFIDELAKGATPIAKIFVGDVNIGDLGGLTAGEALFAKILVFFIVLTIVSLAVRTVPRVGESQWISFIIALLVTMLGVRYLTSGALLNAIWLPSGTLSVVLATFLPFIIFFFFTEGFESDIIRKVGWIAFVVIFFGLAYMRWDVLATTGAGGTRFNLAWMYVIIAGLSLIMLIFNKNIHAMMAVQGLMRVKDDQKRASLVENAKRRRELLEELGRANSPTERERIMKLIKDADKTMKDILRA